MVQRLRRLAQLPGVVAFGEVGLDGTKTASLDEQGRALRVLLSGLKDLIATRPLQVHCRENRQGEVLPQLLRVLSEELGREQVIQVHFFVGRLVDLHLWQQAFPNSYFSVGIAVLKHCSDKQIEGIRAIPASKLLLETDSPIRLENGFSTPYILDEVSRRVSEIRGVPRVEILRLSVENANRIFQA